MTFRATGVTLAEFEFSGSFSIDSNSFDNNPAADEGLFDLVDVDIDFGDSISAGTLIQQLGTDGELEQTLVFELDTATSSLGVVLTLQSENTSSTDPNVVSRFEPSNVTVRGRFLEEFGETASFNNFSIVETATTAAQISIDVLVPAYANPCCGGGPNMWSSLIATAGDANRNFAVHAIFNPASGPGSALDPNYLNDAGVGPLADFRNVGGITHGYVATTFGNRPIDDVKADIDAYISGHYAGFVDGIFFDEMSNDLADVGYYQQLHAYVQSQQPGARTIGNPGTTFTNNPSGQTTFDPTDYINSLDTVMTFESTSDQYASNYTSFPHLESLDRLKISHVIHTLANWDANQLSTASGRGAGFLYVTDDVFLNVATDNPYDSLASFWSDFTADLQAHNAAVVLRGDVNLDGVVSFLDISAFIAVLSGGTFQAEADCDENGFVNFLDISSFIAILSGS